MMLTAEERQRIRRAMAASKRPLTTAVSASWQGGADRVKHTVLIHVVMDGKRHGGRDHFDGRAAASLA